MLEEAVKLESHAMWVGCSLHEIQVDLFLSAEQMS